jgi:plastocyanin
VIYVAAVEYRGAEPGTTNEGIIPGVLPTFTVTRGQATQVALKVAAPGIYSLVCTRHAPSMQATVVVLPKERPKT